MLSLEVANIFAFSDPYRKKEIIRGMYMVEIEKRKEDEKDLSSE
jgi:hypothetical protein